MSPRPPLRAAEPDPRWFRERLPTDAVVDSGPLIALFNRADRWHRPVLDWLEQHQHVRLHGTWPVLTEVCALLARRIRNEAALDFLQWVERGAVRIDSPPAASLDAVSRILRRYDGLPLDLADASVAELAARRGIGQILSIDSDFEVYRDARGKPLRNLMQG